MPNSFQFSCFFVLQRTPWSVSGFHYTDLHSYAFTWDAHSFLCSHAILFMSCACFTLVVTNLKCHSNLMHTLQVTTEYPEYPGWTRKALSVSN